MLVKCKSCNIKDTDRNEMVKDKDGYFHPGLCHEKYLHYKAFKEKERQELDQLVETIQDVHDLSEGQIIPPRFFISLQDLRNGNVNAYGKTEKRYKSGIPYSIINEAYKLSKDDFRRMKATKEFTGDLNEFRYCLAIVVNKVNEIAQKKKRAEQSKVEEEKVKQHSEMAKEIRNRLNEKTEGKVNKDNDEINLTSLWDEEE